MAIEVCVDRSLSRGTFIRVEKKYRYSKIRFLKKDAFPAKALFGPLYDPCLWGCSRGSLTDVQVTYSSLAWKKAQVVTMPPNR